MHLSPRVPDLPALELLLSVIELGSLGRAAESHGISQPSASSRIRYLEKLVGVPVLERSTRGSRATPAGALIAEWARTVLDAAHQLDAGISALREERNSHLRLAASQTVAEYLVPKWLIGLRTHNPTTSVALESGNSADVARAVLDGRAEIGFIESPRAPKGLESRPVARDHLVVVVAPDHAWARRKAITLDELTATPLIQRETGSGTRTAFELAVAAHLPDWRPSALLELSSTTAIKTAVAGGGGPAVLSSLAVADELAAGTLRSPAVTDLDLGRTLRAVWPTGRRPTGPARDLYAIAHRSLTAA
ncbi:DNA-binding transcriptional LysR family regulator [Kitasatospora gansuensis]|uniref:DNA-binding transcriptional LysR family regulator n=1 Tax=Kitasatospora gansuensis TaxID=258050 RepID=A0A7W7WKC2_9ACTN|nr:LysR family transcriptional regulator [Kitasatospora gansuensis]MBB4949860.1 DNA-binding transcriptional LysR family regulator [Kitasatospora gansuensis]